MYKWQRQAIAEAEQQFEHPLKQYLLFHEFEQQVKERRLDDIPDKFSGNKHAQAYFGVLKKQLPEALANNPSLSDEWVALAFDIDKSVTESVAENSINPQNIEADIRKKLLPSMFALSKSVGGGMEQAKAIVEMIVQITRVGIRGI